MDDNKAVLEAVDKEISMDQKILEYLKTHKAEKVELEYKIRVQELHKVLMGMIDKAIAENTVEVKTVDELLTLLELELLLC